MVTLCAKNYSGLNSLVGLVQEKKRARIAIKSCLKRGTVFPHSLLYGFGGCGKTHFCRAIAEELNYHFVEVEAAVFHHRDHIVDCLHKSSEQSRQKGIPLLLFIDEIHRLSTRLQETFYYPMKEFRITGRNGQDLSFDSFSFFAATTRLDMLDSNSFVARFPNCWEISRYAETHIRQMVARFFTQQNLSFKPKQIKSIATRCLGIPRTAISLSEKIRDFVVASSNTEVTDYAVSYIFDLEEIDDIGLYALHRQYLQVLMDAEGEPRGIATLAATLRQPEDVLRSTIEPILLELGYVDATPRGRKLTNLGHRHMLSSVLY